MSIPLIRQPIQNETSQTISKDNTIDQEWIKLLSIARDIGITPQEIRNFLEHSE